MTSSTLNVRLFQSGLLMKCGIPPLMTERSDEGALRSRYYGQGVDETVGDMIDHYTLVFSGISAPLVPIRGTGLGLFNNSVISRVSLILQLDHWYYSHPRARKMINEAVSSSLLVPNRSSSVLVCI